MRAQPKKAESRMERRSREMRADVLDSLVRARALLNEYNIHSDWDFGVPTEDWWKALRSVTAALTALDWHRR